MKRKSGSANELTGKPNANAETRTSNTFIVNARSSQTLASRCRNNDPIAAIRQSTPDESPVDVKGGWPIDVRRVETVFRNGVGYDPVKLIESVKGQVGIW